MSRAVPALLLLLVAAPLLLAPAQAQFPGNPGLTIPTLRDVRVGDLNVTMWIMRDAAAAATLAPDPGNPLGTLFNLNFTAGTAGIMYIKANRTANGTYQMRATLTTTPDALRQVEGNGTIPQLVVRPCQAAQLHITCDLNDTSPSGDHALQAYLPVAAPPGPVELRVEVESWRAEEDQYVFQARANATYTLQVLEPVPSFAVRQTLGGVDIYAWAQSSSIGAGTASCQGGTLTRPDHNISRGFPSLACVLAVPRAPGEWRLSTNASGPAWLTFTNPTWQSTPFNTSSGGLGAPVTAVLVQAAAEAPIGAHQLTVRASLERLEGGAWVAAGSGDVAVPFSVTQSIVVVKTPATRIHWELQLPILAVAAGGIGYLAYHHRPPKVQPRSQTLRDLRKSKAGDGGTATAEVVQQQHAEADAAAWDKKRLILEAKREDILQSIRIAEERKARGEITDHVLAGIRERKERQLQQVDKEMEELRG
ncbi:MAG TPA: hypothetical protein VGR28_04235 [Candidatus Thermoplasmatota archaeon]|jgi:hypothetical protein|nr:hypothetical protein [Candidatus Thermoplasmatota archaeon]